MSNPIDHPCRRAAPKPSRRKGAPPELAEVRHAVQEWLDEQEPPPYVAALSACHSLRQMIGSFARITKVLAVLQPAELRRDVLLQANRALRQTQLRDRPGLTAFALSKLLAQTLLDLMDLCESLRRPR